MNRKKNKKNLLQKWVDKSLYIEEFIRDTTYYSCFNSLIIDILLNELIPHTLVHYFSTKNFICNMQQVFIRRDYDQYLKEEFNSCLGFIFKLSGFEIKSLRDVVEMRKKIRMLVVQFLQVHGLNIIYSQVNSLYEPRGNYFVVYIALCPKGKKNLNDLNREFNKILLLLNHKAISRNYHLYEMEQKIKNKKGGSRR